MCTWTHLPWVLGGGVVIRRERVIETSVSASCCVALIAQSVLVNADERLFGSATAFGEIRCWYKGGFN